MKFRPYRRWLSVLVLVLALAGAGGLLLAKRPSGTPLPLETVRFDGELSRVAEEDLRTAVAGLLEGGLLGVDVGRIRRSVEALPWVAAASVRRVWPDMLRITVEQQQPVARWGGAALMNAEARIFRPRELPAGLPSLAGPPGSADRVLVRYGALRRALAPLGFEVTGVTLDERRAWTVTLADGGRLRLGREDIEARIDRFVRAWPRLSRAQNQRIALVDLRYPNGFALRWQQDGD